MIVTCIAERDGLLVFQASSLSVNETDGEVELCVQVNGTMATVGTAFGVNIALSDVTASKRPI